MSGLIYYTDKRRVLPQLERTNSYKDTRNVTNLTDEAKKQTWQQPIINLKDDDLIKKLTEWKVSKNYNLAV